MPIALGRKFVSVPGSIGLLFAFIVSWGLAHGWGMTFGRLFQRLGDWALHIPLKFAPDIDLKPLSFLKTLDREIQQALSSMEKASERGLLWCLQALVEPFLLVAGVLLALALSLAELVKYVNHLARSAPAKIVRHPIVQKITRTIEVTRGIARTTYNQLAARVKALDARVSHVAHAVATMAAAGAHAIPNVIPRLRDLERSALNTRNLPKWLKRHLTEILVGGVLLAALRRVGLGWTRCSQVGKFNKRICGVNPSWLDEFLAASLLLAGTWSFVEFVEEAQEGFDLGLEGLELFIREFRELPIPKA